MKRAKQDMRKPSGRFDMYRAEQRLVSEWAARGVLFGRPLFVIGGLVANWNSDIGSGSPGYQMKVQGPSA